MTQPGDFHPFYAWKPLGVFIVCVISYYCGLYYKRMRVRVGTFVTPLINNLFQLESAHVLKTCSGEHSMQETNEIFCL